MHLNLIFFSSRLIDNFGILFSVNTWQLIVCPVYGMLSRLLNLSRQLSDIHISFDELTLFVTSGRVQRGLSTLAVLRFGSPIIDLIIYTFNIE